MFKKPDTLFITYTHPKQQETSSNRKAVSSYVSRSYRPTSKSIVFEKSQYRPFERKPAEPDKLTVLFPSSERLTAPVLSRSHSDSPQTTPVLDTDNSNTIEKRWKSSEDLLHEFNYADVDEETILDTFAGRFGRALNTDRDHFRFLIKTAAENDECYHALLAQAHSTALIDVMGQPNWKTLYHRGEVMKLLRQRMQCGLSTVDCAIFTTSMLMTVEYAHTDYAAWSLHKRALQQLVASRGGLHNLCPHLTDHMLKNEWWLQILVKSRVVLGGPQLGLWFQDREELVVGGKVDDLPPLFVALLGRQIMTTTTSLMIKQILMYLGGRYGTLNIVLQSFDCRLSQHQMDEHDLRRAVDMVLGSRSSFIEHQVIFGLLLLIFRASNVEISSAYLDILSQAATDMIVVKDRGPLPLRQSLLYAILNIGCAALTSWWRRCVPSMEHIIPMLGSSVDRTEELRRMLHRYYLYDMN